MPRLTIDGREVVCADGQTLLAALEAAGVGVPHLCHDARLQSYGSCRLCVVEVEGHARPVASCAEPAVEGMVVHTHTPALERLRRTNLQLLAVDYPAAAVEAEPQLPLHRLLTGYGIEVGGSVPTGATRFVDDTHPYLGVDMTRCIHCDRCVRICDEVQGQSVWQIWGRGPQTRIAPRVGQTLIESGCVACGACVDTCPSGALHDKRSVENAERWTRTTCVYCGVGCQMDVGTRDNRIVQIRPADAPVNRGHLCVKGRYAWEFVTAPDRVTTPMIRREGEWQPVSWDEALDFTAAQLRAIRDRAGPDAIGLLGSARATNEENYLMQKLARVALGTHNVDTCARVCHTPSAKALKDMLGTGAATNHFDDIEQAATILLCGCNPTECHPVVGARIKQAVRRGARLIVIDPRRIELADYAELHLALTPGTNVLLLNALAATIVEEGLVDAAYLSARVDDFDAFSAFIRDYAPERVAQRCGVGAGQIRAAARLYASHGPAMCFHGLGTTEHLQGAEGVMCLINLALLTGNLGRPGAGINPLRGQNNVQGGAHMGCDPATLPGGQSFQQGAPRCEAVWGRPLPARRGLNLMEMIDAAADGRLHALWAFGYDIYLTLANAQATAAALDKLDLLIVQDLYLNETAKAFGTVFLPAASWIERDGTFMNSDRRVQRIRKALDAPGQARPDWWILRELARRVGDGTGFDFASPQAIWDEVRAVWPGGAGLSYARLERENPHWPCPDEQHPGTPVLHIDRFAGFERAALRRIDHVPSPEQCDADFPLLLNTGRTLYHFNAGTMSARTPQTALQPTDVLDIGEEDAQRMGLVDGQTVRVISRHGAVELPLRVSATVKPGELFASFHDARRFVNRLTSPVRDRLVGTPEYKRTAVRVEKI
ncbi:formate dehydrogenase subunit alpha [Fontimonas sp. SYSU GA230001]|uniref:formate dehydrogenase subunit alpha n=1 Tax=Fontimonas sp. SYSU GA230001 TaxID=3142450 RepID=UPI0032B382F1